MRKLMIVVVLLSLPVLVRGLGPRGLRPETGLQIVTRIRAAYATPVPASEVPEMLSAMATELNAALIPGGPFGLLKKAHGANCGGYSCDVLCSGQGSEQRQWDVLSDVENRGRPTFHEILGTKRVDVCVPPAIGHPSTPPPSTPLSNPTDVVDLGPLTKRVSELEKQVSVLEGLLHQTQASALTQAQVEALLQHYGVEGPTSRNAWHGHQVKLPLVRVER